MSCACQQVWATQIDYHVMQALRLRAAVRVLHKAGSASLPGPLVLTEEDEQELEHQGSASIQFAEVRACVCISSVELRLVALSLSIWPQDGEKLPVIARLIAKADWDAAKSAAYDQVPCPSAVDVWRSTAHAHQQYCWGLPLGCC